MKLTIHNRQGAWLGDYNADTYQGLLDAVRADYGDVANITGNITDMGTDCGAVLSGGKMVQTDYNQTVLAE